LSYATLDDANGGIVRNLNPHGVGIHAVGALHQNQRVRVRFELRYPRLRLDSQGEVAWADPSGQCGIRFVGLSERAAHQINEWIFGNLLDSISRDTVHNTPILQAAAVPTAAEVDDGLILSAAPRPAIQLEPAEIWPDSPPLPLHRDAAHDEDFARRGSNAEPDWLSRPLSGRTLAWLIDSLVMVAGLLLFALIFLAIAHELPKWPLTLAGAAGAGVFVVVVYWAMFSTFGGSTLGARLARIAGTASEEEEESIEDEVRLR